MKKWRQSQQETARLLGGQEQPASGARPAYKGDVIVEGYLCEDKYTEKPYIVLQRVWLTKIMQEAVYRGVKPMLTFRIANFGKWQMVRGSLTNGSVIPMWGSFKKIDIGWLQGLCYPACVLSGHDVWILTRIP